MWKDIISKELIVINPDVKDKADLFEKMVNHIYNNDLLLHRKKFLKALREREKVSNTELIPGVALPHAHSESVQKLFLSIIILKDGLDYENEKMGPVKIVFFFGSSKRTHKQYLKYLAKTSRLLKNKQFREELLNAEDADRILEIIDKYVSEEKVESDSGKYLMLLILYKSDKIDDVLSSMVELGITNASLVDADSVAKKLAYEMPVFAGLSYMKPAKSKKITLILATIERKLTASKLADLLLDEGIDLKKPGNGYIQLIPVTETIGTNEEDIEL